MKRTTILLGLLISGLHSYTQNDLDAIRYSRYGINGTSRFVALGGAFGAIGADLSCAAYNPAGLGVYRKGEITFSGGLRTTNNQGIINSKSSSINNAKFAFNNFGILGGWQAKNDPESRHVIAFTNTQTQNFLNKTRMSSYTNSNSILKDMQNLANNTTNLNSFYEGMAYQIYLLDYDTVNKKYNSLLDTKRSVKQTRDIVISGKLNELNFSYAYAYKDQFYFGVSVGLPRVEYTSTTTHAEVDDKDSMRITYTSPTTYTSNYIEQTQNLHSDYFDLGGFNSLSYTEYFKTKGSGINLKIGGIYRINDNVRVGAYYHTPTIYTLKDEYYNTMAASFDKKIASPITTQDPEDGGYFNYTITTPSRLSFSSAFIIGKLAAIGVDYEMVNYKNASLSSENVGDFAGVNAVIKNKYTMGHNVRIGTEFNIKPVMLRLGYNLQGSPFGELSGDFVRNSFSVGAGFRTKNNLYFDFVWVKTVSNETYSFFNTIEQKAIIKYNATNVSATVGIKF